MLILASNGLTSQSLLDAVRDSTARAATAALVVTADEAYKADNYHVPRCVRELESLGLAVRLFDLDADPASRLLDFDVVEFIGGNPFYLLHSIRAHRAAPVLEALARDRVLIGWSAAAFVFGPSLELVNRYSPELNGVGLDDLTALCLTDAQVLPHYSRYRTRFSRFEETCAEYEAARHCAVHRLDDGDALLIDGGDVRVVRG